LKQFPHVESQVQLAGSPEMGVFSCIQEWQQACEISEAQVKSIAGKLLTLYSESAGVQRPEWNDKEAAS